jgi:hypothetical protein
LITPHFARLTNALARHQRLDLHDLIDKAVAIAGAAEANLET